MEELSPNEIVVILRALFWEEEKWENARDDCRSEGQLKNIKAVRRKLSEHLRAISFTMNLK